MNKNILIHQQSVNTLYYNIVTAKSIDDFSLILLDHLKKFYNVSYRALYSVKSNNYECISSFWDSNKLPVSKEYSNTLRNENYKKNTSIQFDFNSLQEYSFYSEIELDRKDFSFLRFPLFFEERLVLILEIGVNNNRYAQVLNILNETSYYIGHVFHFVSQLSIMTELLSFLSEQTKQLEDNQIDLLKNQHEIKKRNKELREKNKNLNLQKKELNRINQELIKKQTELIVANKHKTEFLTNMSHELRTPLNSVILLSKLMSKNLTSNLSNEQIEYSNAIHDSGTNLLELVNDILDLSKIDSGKLEVVFEPVKIQTICEKLKTIFNSVASKKGVEFIIIHKNDAPEIILTDQMRLEQILKNLLSNSFKFTERGSVTLQFMMAKPNSVLKHSNLTTKDLIHISVSDTGKGIEEKNKKSIFEAFKQEDNTIQRKFGGTGLGLSISSKLAKLLGGKLYLESSSNTGSTFSILLPMLDY